MVVFNGKTRGRQQSTMDTIAVFQEVFGDKFWQNACIVITHWSNSEEQVNIRKQQGITKEAKKQAILSAVNETFPSSRLNGLEVPVYFTDVYDLAKAYDKTRRAAEKIVGLAQKNKHYDTSAMRKCPCAKWRDLKDKILGMHLNMLNEDVIANLGKDELNVFAQHCSRIIGQVELDSRAIEMSQADFRRIRQELRDAKDRALDNNTKRLARERIEAEEEKYDQTKETNEEIKRREDENARFERQKLYREEEKQRLQEEKKKLQKKKEEQQRQERKKEEQRREEKKMKD